MPSFAQNLERTLHTALAHASERRHEYATLEHLLLALIDDEDGAQVMAACGVDLAELGEVVKQYLDQEYQSLKTEEDADPQPTAGFQRVIQRAILHVQSSGKDTDQFNQDLRLTSFVSKFIFPCINERTHARG